MLTFLSWISDCGIFLFFLLFFFWFWLELEWDCYIHMYFQAHCKIYPYKLMYYFSDHLPRLSFFLYSIRVTYFFVIPPLGHIAYPPSCVQPFSLCLSPVFVGLLYHTYSTINNLCRYIFSPLDHLATVVSVCVVYSSFYRYLRRLFEFLLLPWGCITPLVVPKSDPLSILTV